jgi:hypothetical protein
LFGLAALGVLRRRVGAARRERGAPSRERVELPGDDSRIRRNSR